MSELYISLFPLSNHKRNTPSLENRRLTFVDNHPYFMGTLMNVSDFLDMPEPEPDERGFCGIVKIFHMMGRIQMCAALYLRKVEGGGYFAYEHVLDCEGRIPSPTIEQAIIDSGTLPFNLRSRMA